MCFVLFNLLKFSTSINMKIKLFIPQSNLFHLCLEISLQIIGTFHIFRSARVV